MTYTPAVTTPPPAVGNTGAIGGNGNGTGVGTSSGAADSGTTAPQSGPVDLPASGPATTTAPSTGQSPQLAPSTPQTKPAALAKKASSMPGNPFWLAAIAIALLIGVAAVVLADDAVPVPNPANTRLGRVLRDRERERLNQTTTLSRV
jgi:hypothetical protein